MAERDWIEQDEFDRRRALFAAKFTAPTAPQASAATDRDKTASQPADSQLTVSGIAGDVFWGPATLAEGTRVDAFLTKLAVVSQKPGASMRLLQDQRHLHRSDLMPQGVAKLTLVYVDPPPDNAVVIGDLAVWSKAPTKVNACAVGRKPPDDEILAGRSGRTDETFFHKSSLGRCNNLTLRFGHVGLYYNSSSHGTVTLAFHTYTCDASNAGNDSDAEEDDESYICQDMRAIIPGPHCHGPKDDTALVDARQLLAKLFEASGRRPPGASSPVAAAVTDLTTLLNDLGVNDSAAILWTVLYMPWLHQLGSMNEAEVWEWGRSGYPDDLSAVPEDSRQRLQRGIEEHF